MASSSRSTMAPGGIGSGTNVAGGAASNLSIAEQLMQLDQAITLTLQDIDANLSAAHQTVTSKILPAVKRYGVASARTWQGAKFWMKFFEAAADVSLSGTSSGLRAGQDEHGADETESDLLHDGDDITQSQGADEYDDDDEQQESPVAAHAPRGKEETRKQEAKPNLDDDDPDYSFDMAQLRDNLPVSSSIHYGQLANASEPRSSRISTTPRAEPRRSKISSEVPDPRAAGTTTPEERPLSSSVRVLNAEASARRWDGIADLRSTPLNARGKRFGARVGAASGSKRLSASPRKTSTVSRYVPEWSDDEEQDDEGDSLPPLIGMSPPRTIQFSVPRSRYMNTPAKEAARQMVDDVLRTIDTIADPLAVAARYAPTASSSSSKPLASVVGTPLRKDKHKANSKNRPRDSLPTPPTVTKLPSRPLSAYLAETKAALSAGKPPNTTPLGAPGNARTLGSAVSAGATSAPDSRGVGSNAGRVMDEGEDEGAVGFDFSDLQLRPASSVAAAPGPATERVKTLLNIDDEDSDSQSDTDSDDDALVGANVIPAYPATASKSSWTVGSAQGSSGGSRTTGSRQGRSIEDDTLFGVRAPSASTSAMQNPFAKPTTASGTSRGSGAAGPSVPTYQPIESTIHGGRSLIGVDRSDTYSAPSPTPFGLGGSAPKR
ncbi:unnamed protein product [Tilletia controversa]|uniref:DASH complex subunit ASK1 n=3 Tax=Tilletia TaxID=13289 RepID=A0A8X7SYB1_9BASI|nr:hypothetical protein CF336_g3424 [Tilletia laevis]KAE8202160.1 hypothetical protein CF328_g2378 [Tilletia controversa]KAE8261977.1 hypothetical protein A4X03_0g2814 [Tilletia caries]KAE8204601.1 hypothetical protein CF335_g2599 [Tilletia laevis]KAE8249781.1 hypothetical protein A4X06_0g3064 [Tilletia controversa]